MLRGIFEFRAYLAGIIVRFSLGMLMPCGKRIL
jgi:hypothetical protein